jgi:predicted DNA-binding ribbon-helix-helix protein
MPNPPVTVRLDHRRLEQLKAIAQAEGSSVADVVAQIIRTKIAEGVISSAIPGVTVQRVSEGVLIDLGEGKSVTYGSLSAREFANAIRTVVQGGSSIVSLDHHYGVVRQGTGIKIVAPFPGPEVAFPVSLAEDLANLVDEALK